MNLLILFFGLASVVLAYLARRQSNDAARVFVYALMLFAVVGLIGSVML